MLYKMTGADVLGSDNAMKTLIVVHFNPIERFPPAFNLLRILAANKSDNSKILLITTNPAKGTDKLAVPGVIIYRTANTSFSESKLGRLRLYMLFYIKTFFLLVRNNASAILYYETLSAAAPWLYMKFRKSFCKLFIHYHEYTSPEELKTGMALIRWLHKLELPLYKKAAWVSHTNNDRLKLFLEDAGFYAPYNNFILPNYPPKSWSEKISLHVTKNDNKIGFVYVGALDTQTMYLKEMASFILANSEFCYWDIYSENCSVDAALFLNGLTDSNIDFKGGISYDLLPETLNKYQVGLILYKGHIPNYVFNIPNKLFEYAVCNLDVWFPKGMKSSLSLLTSQTWPKILSLNFESLDEVDILKITDRTSTNYQPFHFEYESVLHPLFDKLNKS